MIRSHNQLNVPKGYETRDVHAVGIIIAIFAFGLFAVISGVVGYKVGKAYDARVGGQDGPRNKWSHAIDLHSTDNLVSSPVLQSGMGWEDVKGFDSAIAD